MRIGLVLNEFPETSETFILHHAAALIDGGHDLTIFAQRATPPVVHQAVAEYGMMDRARFLRRQRWGARQLIDVPLTLVDSWRIPGVPQCLNVFRYGTGVLRFRALHALREFHGESFDLLHCHYASIGWAFLPFREVFGVPLITSFHGDHYASFGRDGGGHLGALFRDGDAFVANGAFTAGELRHLGCPPQKIHVIPAVVSDQGVEFRPRAAGAPGPDGAIRMLCVARLDEAKGIHVAMAAVAQLRAAGHRATLHVVGDGPDRARLEACRAELGLDASVEFTGWLSQGDVYAQYRAADLLVLPSIGDPASGSNESQGVVLQEAMLHGVPVVASDIGGVPESLDGGAVGRLVPPGDAEALAAAILSLANDPESTRATARAAAEYVRGRYLKSAVLRAHETMYEAVLTRYHRAHAPAGEPEPRSA